MFIPMTFNLYSIQNNILSFEQSLITKQWINYFSYMFGNSYVIPENVFDEILSIMIYMVLKNKNFGFV